MPTLSFAQIQMYAQSAGLSADRARIAAAIALAESSGRTDAHNAVPPDNSYGLWQINMLGPLGPARRAKLGITSNSALYDPGVNARAMAMISNTGRSFSAWTTYQSGAYKKHLSGAAGAATPAGLTDPPWWMDLVPGIPGVPGDPQTPDLVPGVPSIPGLEGITSLAELALGAARWIGDPHNWLRVAQVLVGGGLVYVGIAMTLGKGALPAVKQLAAATPTGRAATAATTAKAPAKASGKAANAS